MMADDEMGDLLAKLQASVDRARGTSTRTPVDPRLTPLRKLIADTASDLHGTVPPEHGPLGCPLIADLDDEAAERIALAVLRHIDRTGIACNGCLDDDREDDGVPVETVRTVGDVL